jgi:hypothetical protein
VEFVVADAALDIAPELVATEFAARMPVENAHFPAVNKPDSTAICALILEQQPRKRRHPRISLSERLDEGARSKGECRLAQWHRVWENSRT